jgi:hypothetical protein
MEGQRPRPTLSQFQHHVAEGRLSYFVAGCGAGGGGAQGGTASQITAWVKAHFTAPGEHRTPGWPSCDALAHVSSQPEPGDRLRVAISAPVAVTAPPRR